MIRTNYFVEYLLYNNNGRLDDFMDHKNDMYVLNNEYENVNRSVSGYIKYTNHLTSYGAISHILH